MKRLCLVVFMMVACFAWAEQLQANEFSTTREVRAKVEEFMKLIVVDEVDEAFQVLKPYWLFPENEWAQLQIETNQKMAMVEPRYGQNLGYVFVREEAVRDTVLRLIYIQMRERHLLQWRFLFYKPNDTWILNACLWDDDIEALFK